METEVTLEEFLERFKRVLENFAVSYSDGQETQDWPSEALFDDWLEQFNVWFYN